MSKILKRYDLNLGLDENHHPACNPGIYRGNIELPTKIQLLSALSISYLYNSNMRLCLSAIEEDSYSKKTQKYELIPVKENVYEFCIDSYTFLGHCIDINHTYGTNISYDIFYKKLS